MEQQRLLLDLLAGVIANLNVCVDLLEKAAQKDPEWFDSKNYPHGAAAFRRHIRAGMPAIKCGRGYRCKRLDAECFWESLNRKPRAPSDSVEDLLRASGVIAT